MSVTDDSLKDLALTVCAKQPSILIDAKCREENFCDKSMEEEDGTGLHLPLIVFTFRDNVYIPEDLSEQLFRRLTKKLPDYAIAFHNLKKCRLRSIDLSDLNVPRNLLAPLFEHPLENVCLKGCFVDVLMLDNLKRCRKTLNVLDLTSSTGTKNYSAIGELIHLRRLDLGSTYFGKIEKGNLNVLQSLTKLSYLDLSNCYVKEINPLYRLRGSIEWLSLYNCSYLRDPVALSHSLISLQNLVYLDLSKDPIPDHDTDQDLSYSLYPSVTPKLLAMIAHLPRLKSLDISGSPTLREEDLQPLFHRKNRLCFLGLFKTEACEMNNIPVEIVTGEANEPQILAAFKAYIGRSVYMLHALRCLYSWAQIDRCVNVSVTISLIINVMRTHCKDCGIQIAASASLYYLSKPDESGCTPSLRREIVNAILLAMENHRTVSQLQKNCCLTLANFNYANDLGIQYLTVARLLLDAFTEHRDNYLRRIAITIFNAIVCIKSCDGKSAIGKIGSIARILAVVKEHILGGQINYIMETCWSSLWNITDETPANCERFLNGNGMDLFLKCFNEFSNSSGLLRNMMGLLGNVAEVDFLRPRLLEKRYLEVFASLLRSKSYGLEVSYNAAGVISHLASDGPDSWTCDLCIRDTLMQKVIDEIQVWDIRATRNINYRSFRPILRLLNCHDVDCAQQWAVWALANLTLVYPYKYCKLVREEEGVEILTAVLHDPRPSQRTKTMASDVLSRVEEELQNSDNL